MNNKNMIFIKVSWFSGAIISPSIAPIIPPINPANIPSKTAISPVGKHATKPTEIPIIIAHKVEENRSPDSNTQIITHIFNPITIHSTIEIIIPVISVILLRWLMVFHIIHMVKIKIPITVTYSEIGILQFSFLDLVLMVHYMMVSNCSFLGNHHY